MRVPITTRVESVISVMRKILATPFTWLNEKISGMSRSSIGKTEEFL